MKYLSLITLISLFINTLLADTTANSSGEQSPVVYVETTNQSPPFYNFYFVEETGTQNGYIPLNLHSDGVMSLIVGETYIFKRLAGATSHPFFITDDSNGGSPSNKITINNIGPKFCISFICIDFLRTNIISFFVMINYFI